MPFTVGIDVGGTFTDLIAVNAATGEVKLAKVPTTVDNQAFGVMNAISAAGITLADVDVILHGTTATTNAVLERKLAKVGLITTMGFRDSLELGRRTRPTPYGLKGHFEPLISRELRIEIPERMLADGSVHVLLDEVALNRAIDNLLGQNCESLVIHFLHSYQNPAHEQRAAAIARARWPNAYVSVGHELVAEYREYERGVTAAVNASVQPILARYIATLLATLAKDNPTPPKLLIMQGNGGTVAAEVVAKAAVQTVMSGPASGVMAAVATSRAAGFENVITYDMGGTSTDVGLVKNGQAQVSSELELEYAMPLRVPLVDVHTVGAGGGSIAFVNDAGLLQVGPKSAGATPGPICYGRGGTEPTITDANVLLGRLDISKLLGVNHQIPAAQIGTIFDEIIGKKLGLSALEAAHAVVRIANDKMAGAIRMVSLAKGHDPRDFALFPFGGAGPLHACALAAELNIPTLLIPARPGITNALGCALADLRHDFVNTLNTPLATLDMAQFRATIAAQIEKGNAALTRDGLRVERVDTRHALDMQFAGQSHLLRIEIADVSLSREALADAFAQAYWQRFQVKLPEMRPVLVNIHTAVIGVRKSWPLEALKSTIPAAQISEAIVATRKVWFDGGMRDTPVFSREKIPAAQSFDGPAIIEQMDCTIVIESNWRAEHDSLGNLVVKMIKTAPQVLLAASPKI
jgi:N-methylhydantoinase A